MNAPKTLGIPEIHGIPDEVQLSFFDWEIKDLRQTISTSLAEIDENSYKTVIVPQNVFEKLRNKHSTDIEHLNQLGDVLNQWDYAGKSPKDIEKIEFYKNLDGIWFTAVVKKDEQLQAYILTTFHRIYKRKLDGRIEKYLHIRK